MKKVPLKKLAILGIVSGVVLAQALEGATLSPAAREKLAKESEDPNAGNLAYHLMTEDELLLELTDDGVKLYNSLTPEGKALARKVASTSCNGTNECAGLNACKTDKNECAGQGKCKGQGKCNINDKNLAVRLVAKKMADKRAQTLQSKP
jgi:hypothetical protein